MRLIRDRLIGWPVPWRGSGRHLSPLDSSRTIWKTVKTIKNSAVEKSVKGKSCSTTLSSQSQSSIIDFSIVYTDFAVHWKRSYLRCPILTLPKVKLRITWKRLCKRTSILRRKTVCYCSVLWICLSFYHSWAYLWIWFRIMKYRVRIAVVAVVKVWLYVLQNTHFYYFYYYHPYLALHNPNPYPQVCSWGVEGRVDEK